MIDREVIENLIKLMVEHELVELDVADGDQSITLRRAEPHAAAAGGAMPMMYPAALQAGGGGGAAAPAAGAAGSSAGAAGGVDAAQKQPKHKATINSPMVGTYYSRPNPDTDAFVTAGSKVSDSTVVCLVEAMKVFNEVKAEMKGTITEVLVNDGDAVEYGQPLFAIDPA